MVGDEASKKQREDVYNIMKKCWDILPENRPTFLNLQVELERKQRKDTGYGKYSIIDN